MSGLYISAAHKSSGKTIVSLGLCAALRARGLAVQPCKKGPDYIDPMWLTAASGRACRNLDFWTMTAAEIQALYARSAAGADLVLVEGNKGLHDGLSQDGHDSSAALAKLLGLPVVLVIDTEGMTRGIAPLLLGMTAFEPGVRISGVILNKVGGARHEAKLRAAIAAHTDLPVLGAIARDTALSIDERHLGLIPANEHTEAQARIDAVGAAVAAQVDLDAVLALAGTAYPAGPVPPCPAAPRTGLRIAIARDAAFGFYYQDDLDALTDLGCALLPFDALRDTHLPPGIDGLFIGGGFPEMHLPALAANISLRQEIAAALAAGLPAYAECGGLMYLSRAITHAGERWGMVGALPAEAVMMPRPQGRGYVRLSETADMPWPGRADTVVGHEFHHAALTGIAPEARFAYRVRRGHGIGDGYDGLLGGNVLGAFTHLRGVGANRWPERFVAFVQRCAAGRGTALLKQGDTKPWQTAKQSMPETCFAPAR